MQKMTRRAALAAIPAMGAAATVPAIAKSADADLLELGREFEAAFAIEEAARHIGRETDDWTAWDAAYAKTDAIVKRIEKMPATTMEGVHVKARCVQWCYGSDPVFHDLENYTTDMRLAQGIVLDLLALG